MCIELRTELLREEPHCAARSGCTADEGEGPVAQQDRAIRTRRLILEAAAAVFDARGYEAATIGEILANAGVTKGALYFHFPSKEELALAVLEEQATEAPVIPQASKLQELVDIGMLLAYRLRHDPLVRASVRLTLDQGARGLDRRGPFRSWSQQTLQRLVEAREQGELLPHVVLEETADVLVGSFAGVQLMSQTLSDRADLAFRVSSLLRHIMPGIAVPAVLASLDTAPDRGERLLDEWERTRDAVGAGR